MTDHREVPVKVNAWVDEGIADLVSALSELSGLVTLESCQGHAGKYDAFVIFRYGDWQQCGRLLFGEILPRMSPDLRADVSLRLQAYDTDTASGSITLEPSAVPAFTRYLREVLSAEMPIAPETIEKAQTLLDTLRCARDLRSCLVTEPSAKLQLFALEKNESLYGETTIGPKLNPDLRLAIVDYVIERIEKRLGDLDVAIP